VRPSILVGALHTADTFFHTDVTVPAINEISVGHVDLFVVTQLPYIGLFGDESLHHLHALCVIEDRNLDSALSEMCFGAEERLVLPYYDSNNPVEDAGTSA
jgi:hypothetical protein